MVPRPVLNFWKIFQRHVWPTLNHKRVRHGWIFCTRHDRIKTPRNFFHRMKSNDDPINIPIISRRDRKWKFSREENINKVSKMISSPRGGWSLNRINEGDKWKIFTRRGSISTIENCCLPRVKGLRDRCKGCWWHVELNIEKFDRRSIIVPSVHSVVKFDRTADGDWSGKERGLINHHHPLCVFSNAVKNSFHAYFETK